MDVTAIGAKAKSMEGEMRRHPFSPIGDSSYCAYVYGICDDEVCGDVEEASIHLSDDVENDRFIPFEKETNE